MASELYSEPTRSLLDTIAAVVTIAVMLLGAGQVLSTLLSDTELVYPKTRLDFREGRTTSTLEKQIDHKLPARNDLIAAANSIRLAVTGGTGEQVRAGKDGWLFLTDEIRFEYGSDSHMRTRIDLLAAVSSLLNQQGVKLVVLLVPDKARVHSDRLLTGRYPTSNESRYQQAINQLSEKNVAVVDILTPLRKQATSAEVYYRTDTHWNQLGAKIAAHATAIAIGQMKIPIQKVAFESSESSDQIERAGDLIRMIGLESVPPLLRPKNDYETVATTTQTTPDPPSSLFGDSVIDVALTGTSYSLRGNFHGYLQEALSTKVLNGAKDGGGLLQATKQYLTDEAFKTSKAKILIWEIPERFLQAKLDGENAALAQFGLLPH
jgi:alginate O-acetyltransferase complex protein AlgJ